MPIGKTYGDLGFCGKDVEEMCDLTKEFPVLALNRHRMRTDGRGITTLVALAGCPLSCAYCINAKILKKKKQIRKMTTQELIEQLAIDHCYFLYTGGGVTFGGGEPLLHSAQIAEFAQNCPKEWNLTLETSLNVPTEHLEPVLSERFSYIIDVKAMQPDIYASYTGMDNGQVIRNLTLVCKNIPKEQYVVKIPQIPQYTKEEDIERSRQLLQKRGVAEENIVVFPYKV